MFSKVEKFINGLSTTVMTVCMSAATVVAFINAMLRSLFGTSMPWFFALLLELILITHIPATSLFIPNMIYGG
jgi:TRAP-type C4-dicarboxylate transport system permease small subunit